MPGPEHALGTQEDGIGPPPLPSAKLSSGSFRLRMVMMPAEYVVLWDLHLRVEEISERAEIRFVHRNLLQGPLVVPPGCRLGRLEPQAAGRDDDAGVHADTLVEYVPLTDHATGAEHGEAAHDGVVADPGARAHDRTPHDSASLYFGAVKEYAPLDHSPLPTTLPFPSEERPPMVARSAILHSSAIETGGKSLTFLPHSTDGSTSRYSKPSRAPTAPERTSWEAAR